MFRWVNVPDVDVNGRNVKMLRGRFQAENLQPVKARNYETDWHAWTYLQSELLIALSDFKGLSLYESIMLTLANNLNHPSPRVRYGSIVGISRTGNFYLLDELHKAKRKEKSVIIVNILNRVIEQLDQIKQD